MKKISLLNAPAFYFAMIVMFLLGIVLWLPATAVLADSNAPTETNTPEPTSTNTPIPPTEEVSPTDTAIPMDTQSPDNILGATPIPLPTAAPSGGLSPLNRVLLVCLSVVTVLVIGVIVYLVYYQTRGSGLGER
jgi:hypothetical protein